MQASRGDDCEIKTLVRRDQRSSGVDRSAILQIERKRPCLPGASLAQGARSGMDQAAAHVRLQGLDQRAADAARGAEDGGAVTHAKRAKLHGRSTLGQASGFVPGRNYFEVGRRGPAHPRGLKTCALTPIWRKC